MPGFDLILSKCNHNQIILGEVVNGNCTLLRGNIATLSKGFDQYKLPRFDTWYLTRLRVQPGYTDHQNLQRKPDASFGTRNQESDVQPMEKSVPCLTCKLDMYCSTHKMCQDQFLYRKIVNASLNSITGLLQVGDLPFEAEIRTEVYDSAFYWLIDVESQLAAPPSDFRTTAPENLIGKSKRQPVHYENTAEAVRNSSLKYNIDVLKLNSWYMIRTCLTVRTPERFRQNYPQIFLEDEHKFCLKKRTRYLKQKLGWPRWPMSCKIIKIIFRWYLTELFQTNFILKNPFQKYCWLKMSKLLF